MGEIISPKFKRSLTDYENKRYQELKVLYKKMTGFDYDGKMIENGWLLADIACSSGRYKKYQAGFQKAYEKRREEEIKKSTEETYKKEQEEGDFYESSIEDIIEGFKRFRDFIEIIEVSGKNYKEENCDCEIRENQDMIEAEKIYNEAFNLMKSRNEKYGDSWKVLSIQSLANLCEMKLHRIANLDKIEPKIYDELIDTLNYCVFGLLKLKQQNIGTKYSK